MMIDLASTGLKGLDRILQQLRLGDNVVWQVDSVSAYLHFVEPFVRQARADGKKMVYIRFARHDPLLAEDEQVRRYQLDAAAGFESFSKQVHDIVSKEGEGAFYVFDCLSDLLSAWATDLMIGNFFVVTCPFLFKLRTVAYFALLRNSHSFRTIARIRETTQLLLDVYDFEGNYYLHPLKVWNRYAPTMFLPHQENGTGFLPITSSVDAVRLFSYMSDKGLESASRNLDHWDRLFLRAEGLVDALPAEREEMFDRLCRIMIGREPRMLSLVKQNVVLADLLSIKSRMIGTGYIGGKALGMLLARKVLLRDKSFDWEGLLEPHDSFFIGSDIFYTYIVENGWWELWLEQKKEERYSALAAELREKMLGGTFPEEIREQFYQMLEYFGQSPIIVRSSSLLEDSFGNAFAGKYESIFCANQGAPEERYERFAETVRQVFASTMNEDALAYRQQRGLILQDEQMALLVQRVSGTYHRHYFFPYLAGVGVSYNNFVWHEEMDPKAGMVRLVFGLGTRAVNRVEGDYPRVVALDAPLLRPYAGLEDVKKFSQHDVDAINIDANALQTVSLDELGQAEPEMKLALVAERDREARDHWILTFDPLLSRTDFAPNMRRLLQLLERAYGHPVDVEFTVNYTGDGQARINLLQCRPLQAKGPSGRVEIPRRVSRERTIFETAGNFMGGSVSLPIRRVIYIDPYEYGKLLMSRKSEVARLIGKINRQRDATGTLLIGPGRWGSRDPSLGVPVSFAEINKISALVEVADPASGLMPELSFGSHFFLDLVEARIFYAALFLENGKAFLNKACLSSLPNVFEQILPEQAAFSAVVRVHDFAEGELQLLADIASQKAVCFGRGGK